MIFSITVALRNYGTSAAVVGLAQAGISAGGLLGALVAPKLQGRLPLSRIVVAMTVAGTALFAAGAAVLPSTLVAVPVGLTLMLGPTANAALFAAMLRAAPEDMRGRVNNTVILAASALAALSPLVAGLMVEHLSGRWALLVFAAVMAAAAVLCLAQPGFRNAEAEAAATDSAIAEAG